MQEREIDRFTVPKGEEEEESSRHTRGKKDALLRRIGTRDWKTHPREKSQRGVRARGGEERREIEETFL